MWAGMEHKLSCFMLYYKCQGLETIRWLMMMRSGFIHMRLSALWKQHSTLHTQPSLNCQRIQGSGYGNVLKINGAFDSQLCAERHCQEFSVSTTSCSLTRTVWMNGTPSGVSSKKGWALTVFFQLYYELTVIVISVENIHFPLMPSLIMCFSIYSCLMFKLLNYALVEI